MSDFDGGDDRREYETDVSGDGGDEPEPEATGAATNYLPDYDQGTERGRTRYDDRSTIEDRAAQPAGGGVLGPDGNYMTGTYGWVVDEDTGYLLFLPPDQVNVFFPDGHVEALTRQDFQSRLPELRAAKATYERIHHTTPVAGLPVTGAGIMELDRGWIVSISDESGHYRPTAENQYNAIVSLEQQGFSMERPVSAEDSPDGMPGYRGATVSLTGADGGGRPTSKADWLAEEQARNPYISTDELELRWEQFEQTGGDEVIARRRDALNREFMARQAGNIVRVVAPAVLATDPNFELDPSNNLYRSLETWHYYSAETGDLVYVYDTSSAAYVDVDGNPV